jgi:hypothetical protein
VKYFNNIDDFNDYVTAKEYPYDVCIGVYFEETKDLSHKYHLMFNSTGR